MPTVLPSRSARVDRPCVPSDMIDVSGFCTSAPIDDERRRPCRARAAARARRRSRGRPCPAASSLSGAAGSVGVCDLHVEARVAERRRRLRRVDARVVGVGEVVEHQVDARCGAAGRRRSSLLAAGGQRERRRRATASGEERRIIGGGPPGWCAAHGSERRSARRERREEGDRERREQRRRRRRRARSRAGGWPASMRWPRPSLEPACSANTAPMTATATAIFAPRQRAGQRGRQLDAAERLPARGVERAHQLEQLGVDAAQPVERRDDDREEADERDDRELRRDAEAEPARRAAAR